MNYSTVFNFYIICHVVDKISLCIKFGGFRLSRASMKNAEAKSGIFFNH